MRWVKVREIEGLLSRARIGLDLGTNRLPSAPVAPARDPGEHPLDRDGRERVTVGEVAVHGKADLAGAAAEVLRAAEADLGAESTSGAAFRAAREEIERRFPTLD